VYRSKGNIIKNCHNIKLKFKNNKIKPKSLYKLYNIDSQGHFKKQAITRYTSVVLKCHQNNSQYNRR